MKKEELVKIKVIWEGNSYSNNIFSDFVNWRI
jgi:hypothetical protein